MILNFNSYLIFFKFKVKDEKIKFESLGKLYRQKI